MEYKSSVSALQEFCSQVKSGNPEYNYIEGEDGGYCCKVVVLDVEAYGNGRSKRDAKHMAAHKVYRKISALPDFAGISTSSKIDANQIMKDELVNMNHDMLKELRDYCVRHEMPLPTIEIVQQSGSPNAPEFVACCTLASIKRYGKSDKKKDARQRAAIEMLCVISNESENALPKNHLVSTKSGDSNNLECTYDDIESERRLKFKTYRELIDADEKNDPAIKLCDRHNYFKSFYPHIKEAAFEISKSTEYETSESKFLALLSALKLKSRISELEGKSMEPLYAVEIICDFNCQFIGLKSQIYLEIINYFNEMLI